MQMRHTRAGGCSTSAPSRHVTQLPSCRPVAQAPKKESHASPNHACCSLRMGNGSCQSCSAPCRHNQSQRSLMLRPLRITNTNKEIWDAKGEDANANEAIIEYPNYQVNNPELGRLEGRVKRIYLDALLEDDIDLEETKYWFSTPEEGWNTKLAQVKVEAEEVPVQFPQPQHPLDDGEERMSMEDLFDRADQMGDEVFFSTVATGVITDVWLYHGVQVDLGLEFDGLIPISQKEWKLNNLNVDLECGDLIDVKIAALRMPGLYRWPIQLAAADPVLQSRIMEPKDYMPTIDHAWANSQGWEVEDILAATGREYTPQTYFWRQDDAEWCDQIQQTYGRDVPDMDAPSEHPTDAIWNSRSSEVDSMLAAGQASGRW